MARLVLAATLGASYGIYGPAFELLEHEPREPGSEEYLDSEKYQLRQWNLDRPDSLRDLIARVNRIRREHRALQSDASLRFHPVDNDSIIAYSKSTEDGEIILVVVNLDPRYRQSGWIDLDLAGFGLAAEKSFQVHDLLTDARFLWHGARNYVELDPQHAAGARFPHPAQGAHRARLRLLPLRRNDARRPPSRHRIRSGTRTPSCTKCTCARSSTATTTASATFAG